MGIIQLEWEITTFLIVCSKKCSLNTSAIHITVQICFRDLVQAIGVSKAGQSSQDHALRSNCPTTRDLEVRDVCSFSKDS